MTARQLEAAHARTYKFRARGAQETRGHYRAALIAHLERRDFAAAFEVRLGRPQPDWTAAEVEAFRVDMEARPGPSADAPLPPIIPTMRVGHIELGDQAAIDRQLLEMGRVGLNGFVEMRTKDPQRELQIILTMVLANGEIHITIPARGNRVAILKEFSRHHQMIGFNVAADAFIHSLDSVGGKDAKASKQDAIMLHVGTHASRWMLVRTYRVDGGRVLFDDTREINVRELGAGEGVNDPYAEVMCSVPMSTGAPS